MYHTYEESLATRGSVQFVWSTPYLETQGSQSGAAKLQIGEIGATKVDKIACSRKLLLCQFFPICNLVMTYCPLVSENGSTLYHVSLKNSVRGTLALAQVPEIKTLSLLFGQPNWIINRLLSTHFQAQFLLLSLVLQFSRRVWGKEIGLIFSSSSW